MIKLAFCTDGIFPHAVGGMQRHSRLLIESLAEYQDLEIHVIHPHDETVFAGIQNVVEHNVKGINPDKNYLKECKKYSKRVHNTLLYLEPDIVYSQGLSVWSKAKHWSDRLVVNPHGLEPFQALGKKDKLVAIPFKSVFKKIFRKSKYVVSLGGKLSDILGTVVSKDKIIVLPNATAARAKLDRVYPESNEPLKCMFVARFAHNKGIHILLQAINELNEEGLKDAFFFDLAGKGPLYEEYKLKYNFENIKYWGFISDEDLDKLYASADAFVFPTLFEGMPTVVLEAMSRSQAIIVSDVGATAELVDDTNGYLINRNSVEELKNALKGLHNLGSEQKKALGESSYRKYKSRFTWSAVAESHYELFKTMTQ